MERFRKAKEVLDCCRSYCSIGCNRMGERMVGLSRSCLILSSIGLIGCTTLKKASIVCMGAGAGAIAGTVLSGGAAAPILGATTTAFVTDVVTEAIPIGKTGKKVMNDCAPDNFWSLLGTLIEMGGWALILIVIIPMIFSWLMPGPIQFKKRRKE